VNNPESKNIEVSESIFFNNTLKARGYSTIKTVEEDAHVRKLANLPHQKDKNFLFLIAYDCNFRYPYCYEKNVLKNSRKWSAKVFTKEMVDKAYQTIASIGKCAESGKCQSENKRPIINLFFPPKSCIYEFKLQTKKEADTKILPEIVTFHYLFRRTDRYKNKLI
jgi:hypothetical protein